MGAMSVERAGFVPGINQVDSWDEVHVPPILDFGKQNPLHSQNLAVKE